ncbi:MAG TPA: hypothetical protein DCO86_02850 [Spirochaetaceae bacterium]|nr:hypothetical protein [Spirochaetaceae bacterium]
MKIMRSSRHCLLVSVLALCLMLFGVSCASCKKTDDGQDQVQAEDGAAFESSSVSQSSQTEAEAMTPYMAQTYESRNEGMVRFVGGTPVEILKKALEAKDADSIRVVVFNALSLDYVMPDGRTVRQSILDTGDAGCVAVIEEAENRKSDPAVFK